jgi:hypothetical protein
MFNIDKKIWIKFYRLIEQKFIWKIRSLIAFSIDLDFVYKFDRF